MLRISDTLGGQPITFNYCNRPADRAELERFLDSHTALGIDTESTGVNCYRPGWQLRSVQVGDADTAYVLPARHKAFIGHIMAKDINWIAHNGPHDIRSIDAWLGFETGVSCPGETYIPAHHADSRKQEDGGTGHGLKELAIAHVARDAGKWEVELKKAFKAIELPIPGEVYKSGTRKGMQKMRKAKLGEGWGLIDPEHPAYIAYSAADPILTYRLWAREQTTLRANYELYQFDKRVQEATDKLQRRGMPLDVRYTRRLSAAYLHKASAFAERAQEFGCHNINSGQQLATTLISLGARLTVMTPSGKYKTDDHVLRGLVAIYGVEYSPVKEFIHCVLGAKQMMKRRENYTEAMLREMDANGRVHPSINAIAARTSRMSVSDPALQQLPTKDREEDAE